MRPFTKLASVIFTLLALVHILRLVQKWEVVIGGYTIPLWFSILGIALGLGLGYKLWKESR